MNVLERVVNSVGEPGKHDLWLRSISGGAELLAYLGGEWIPVCGCNGGGSKQAVINHPSLPIGSFGFNDINALTDYYRSMSKMYNDGTLIGSIDQTTGSGPTNGGIIYSDMFVRSQSTPYVANVSLTSGDNKTLFLDEKIYDFIDAGNEEINNRGEQDFLDVTLFSFGFDNNTGSCFVLFDGTPCVSSDGYRWEYSGDENGFITGVSAGEQVDPNTSYYTISEDVAEMLIGVNTNLALFSGVPTS